MNIIKAVTGVLGLILASSFGAPAAAQGQYCPPGFSLINGYCQSPSFAVKPLCPLGMGPVSFGPSFNCAGISSAGAASQSLASTTRAIADQTLSTTVDAIRRRREEELRQCPAGQTRVNGQCVPTGRTAIGFAPEEAYAADMGGGRLVLKAPPSVSRPFISPAFWIQGFADRERRDQSTGTSIPTSATGAPGTLLPPGGLSTSVNLDRVTRTYGVLGGLDFTMVNFAGGDLLTFGALGGYTSAKADFKSIVQTTEWFGPSAGVFAAYVRGPFSADVAFKVDFLTQDQDFVDFPGDIFQTSGSSSIDLKIYSIAANANYRIPLSAAMYIEPTVGLFYANIRYDSGATALGLADNTSTRIQGGLRLGLDAMFGNIRTNTTLTGLAYNYVQVTGGVVPAFLGPGVLPSDEGKTFGQFLLATVYDLGGGLSGFTGGDVRFGNGLLGVGGRGGIRYQWAP